MTIFLNDTEPVKQAYISVPSPLYREMKQETVT